MRRQPCGHTGSGCQRGAPTCVAPHGSARQRSNCAHPPSRYPFDLPPPTPSPTPTPTQTCINKYVLSAPAFAVWNCTDNLPPQTCINYKVDYVANSRCGMLQQQCINMGPSAVPCNTQYQNCVNAFVLNMQKQAAGGAKAQAAAGAAGVKGAGR